MLHSAALRATTRHLLLGCVVTALLTLPAVAQPTSSRLLEPVVRTLTTDDQFPIKITYYESNKGKESPVVILLHDRDGNRFIWQNGGFAEVLHKEGFAVVTVDLRKHGESRMNPVTAGAKPAAESLRPADFALMASEDLPTVKKFLMQEHHDEKLNINKLGIVGPGMGASVATYFTLKDWLTPPYADAPTIAQRTPRGQDVRGVVLISANNKVPPGLPISRAIGELRKPEYNSGFLISSAKLNATDRNEAATLYKTLTTFPDAAKRMYKEEYGTKLTGTAMLGKGLDLEKHMLIFLTKHVKNAESQWRIRRNRAETQ